jgi:hypothetical protein
MIPKIAKSMARAALVFTVIMTMVKSTQAETTHTDGLELKRANRLIATGATLTAVGGLCATAGVVIGFVAIGLGGGDSTAMVGFPALATLGVATPFLGVGIPLLVTGKRARVRLKRESALAYVPRPFIEQPAHLKSRKTYGLRWRLSF